MYLIPKPQKVTMHDGDFILRFDSYICLDKRCGSLLQKQTLLFADSLREKLGYSLLLSKHTAKAGDIEIKIEKLSQEQGYILDTTGDVLVIKGSEEGIWLGMQTLLQMAEQCGATLPKLFIEDYPALKNRGHYLDVTRGRIPKLSWLKQWVDKLAYYKINQFQLYVEHTYLFRNLKELWRDDTPYTARDIMELNEYCKERGVELVPSLSSFGHLYKLLSSQNYGHLCELEDTKDKPFSVLGRMQHHTIDVTSPESFALISEMLEEFMNLFSSKQFNICADETFDLGTGKNKEKAENIGKSRLYIEFVKKLTEFIVSKGRRPMFWGDVIVGFPELIKELPEETICLTWGYAWNQREYEVAKMAEAGATQYCCPGCCGWNEIVNLNWNSYHNIKLMAEYADKHKAIGLLNTDWGDFLHINHPDFSIAGVIYGAAFSWNSEAVAYEEINRQISALEFGDRSESLLNVIDEIRHLTAFSWQAFCHFYEIERGIGSNLELQNKLLLEQTKLEDVTSKNEMLIALQNKVYGLLKEIPASGRNQIAAYLISLKGVELINRIGEYVVAKKEGNALKSGKELADQLDEWFYFYKEKYRECSRESELYKMQEMMNFYGDTLRK